MRLVQTAASTRSSGRVSGLPTYEAGLIQAKAYRVLKKFLTGHLSEENLTMPEWALLGLVADSADGLRLTQISAALSVEAPLATNLVNGLERKGLLMRHRDIADNRVRMVRLTDRGAELVPQLERSLRRDMQHFMSDVSPAELATYMKVLAKIASKA